MTNTSLGVGILTYLLCLLGPIGYKLLGFGHYSWLTATTALWAPVVFTLVLALAHVLVALVLWAYRAFRRKAPQL